MRDLDTSGDPLPIMLGGTIACGLYAALGLGVGAVMRNQVGAIVGSLIYLFVLENLLRLVPKVSDVIDEYGLVAVGGSLFAADDDAALSQVSAGLLFAAYCLVFLIAGLALMRRRDISA